jgi:hypothetical protein
MTSMLALIGGIFGMFVLFGVAWKLLQPTLGWEAIGDELGPTPKTWQNEPTPNRELVSAQPRPLPPPPVWTPIAQATAAYAIPPTPKPVPAPAPVLGRAPARPPPLPRRSTQEDDEGAATQFFDRAMLTEVEATLIEAQAKMDRTEILGDEHVMDLDRQPRRS